MSTDGDRVVRGNRLGRVFYREIIQPSPYMLSIIYRHQFPWTRDSKPESQ
jgi:hypothetical protein